MYCIVGQLVVEDRHTSLLFCNPSNSHHLGLLTDFEFDAILHARAGQRNWAKRTSWSKAKTCSTRWVVMFITVWGDRRWGWWEIGLFSKALSLLGSTLRVASQPAHSPSVREWQVTTNHSKQSLLTFCAQKKMRGEALHLFDVVSLVSKGPIAKQNCRFKLQFAQNSRKWCGCEQSLEIRSQKCPILGWFAN